jgi:3-hydroxy-9,10-secoandrosta-1,3,5(10)-triene-9,17-dione monooxygenase reductase component
MEQESAARQQAADAPAPPIADPKVFRNALGAFATGVTIVTTRGGDGSDVGLTANSFSSVSLNPPMVLWSLAKTSSSIAAFRGAGHFAVHILAADQDALSGRFASKGLDKFAGLDIGRGHDDIPMLHDCTARFECRTAFQYEGGDHVIFVGEVVSFTHSERAPLVFHGGRYGMIVKKEVEQEMSATGAGSSLSSDDLIFHLSRAFFQIRRDAHGERQRRGWTENDYAAISVLGREDGKTVAEIEALSIFPGRHVTPEVIAALAERGLVSVAHPIGTNSKVYLTPVGRQSMIEIIAIIKASEADALTDFDFSEVQMLKLLLRRLSRQSEPGWPPLSQQDRRPS